MPGGKLRALEWVPVPARSRATPAAGDIGVDRAHPVLAALDAVGVPQAPGATTARDEAVFLLQAAAEVEHLLLVQYLYAAYSLDSSQADPAAWQQVILGIAHEEMGHLATVQNLLQLLGSDTYLERENYQDHGSLYPFPFQLEPLTKQSLSRYVVAESPVEEQLPPDLADLVATLGPINHVAVIYAKIYWLFQSSDTPQGPFTLPPSVAFPPGLHLADTDLADAASLTRQTSNNEWGAAGGIHVDATTTRDTALAAIDVIAIQGEGISDSDPSSHFARFLNLYNKLTTSAVPHPALPVPVNQTTGPSSTTASAITDPTTLPWAVLFNRRYEILLLDIMLGLGYGSTELVDGVKVRTRLTRDWAVRKEMQVALAGIAAKLVASPLGGPPGAMAGPPFELPATGLPTTRAQAWQRQRNLIDECQALIDQIGLANDDDNGTLAALADFDTGRTGFIDARIQEGDMP